jgi:hypothetical protein
MAPAKNRSRKLSLRTLAQGQFERLPQRSSSSQRSRVVQRCSSAATRVRFISRLQAELSSAFTD